MDTHRKRAAVSEFMTWGCSIVGTHSRKELVATATSIAVGFLAVLMTGQYISAAGQGNATPHAAQSSAPAFVSSTTCAECHAQAYEAWEGSHHSWALRIPNAKNVLADFNNADFEHSNVRSRFFQRDGSFFVETDGLDGKPAEFEVRYTVGITPLQQYLVEMSNGRLQALDLAWDTEQKRWFHLYPDEELKAGNGLHWTGPYKNWQARCAECHQTNFIKGYSPKARTYQSKWSELTVGCESCHGPGEAHVAWAKDPASYASQRWQGLNEKGLTVSFSPDVAKKEIEVCAPCHSRRSTYDADSPPPGSKFADHYRLALLTQGLYHADGQIDGEVYVYGSFLQSRMYARGVRCSSCHEPHSGQLRADGNAVCTQCHSPAGNNKFATLRKAAYDDPSHHHHKTGSEGAKCANCHMPAKTYMQVDPRRDHSFRVPRPDLAQKIGTPNACTGCHDDRTANWATATLKDWFPEGQTGTPHYGEALHAGRTRSSPETANKLVALALDDAQPAIVRATALDLMLPLMTEEHLDRVSPLIKDQSALLRAAVLPLYHGASPRQKTETALSVIGDPARAVRIEAAKLFLGVPLKDLSDAKQKAAQRVIAEYQNSLLARADYPETQMQIAGLFMTLRKFEGAQAAFREALAMDPQLADAWITLARIQWALQRPDQAIETLERAKQQVPDSGDVFLQLGSLYLQQRQPAKAVLALEKSLELGSLSPELLDMLAVAHLAAGNNVNAHSYAARLAKEFPLHQASPLLRRILRMNK